MAAPCDPSCPSPAMSGAAAKPPVKKRPAAASSPATTKTIRPKQTERRYPPMSPAWADVSITNDASVDLAIPANLKTCTVVTFCPTSASPLPSLR
eukprot:7577674-Lingulodinium_polyedra.AAC.1